jgi:hypothetical protein
MTFLGIGIVGDTSIRVYFVNRFPVGVIVCTTPECSGFLRMFRSIIKDLWSNYY